MAQRDDVYNTLVAFCAQRGLRTFELQDFLAYCDYNQLGITGNTPDATVRRLLQEMRDARKLSFKEEGGRGRGQGQYTLLHPLPLRGETSDDIAIRDSASPHRREYLIETHARQRGWVKLAREKFGEYCLMPQCKNTFDTERGAPYIEVHHITPLFDGGEDGLWNLAVVCAHHHRMAHFADEATRVRVSHLLRQETEKRL